MNYTVVSDIFGNRLEKGIDKNNGLPFVILHTAQPHLLMSRIGKSESDGVWTLDYPLIMHALYANRLTPARFAPLGHLYTTKAKLPDKVSILLVNTDPSISVSPIDYTSVGMYRNMHIWKPIAPKGYSALGYMVSSDKPDITRTRVVNDNLVTEYRDRLKPKNGMIAMNEFNFVSFEGEKRKTVKRSELLRAANMVRLQSNRGRFITRTNDRQNHVDLVPESVEEKQRIKYAGGQIKLEDKCIGVNPNKWDNFAYLQDCDDSSYQSWYPYRDHYVSEHHQRCLSDSGDQLEIEECNFADPDQSWMSESLQNVIQDSFQEHRQPWKTRKGKRVVLIEDDNPWYINKVHKPIGIRHDKRTELNKVDYRDNADFYSKFMMDTHNPSMGYGYSYADRAGKPCHCVDDCDKPPTNRKIFEHFDNNNDDDEDSSYDFTTIAISLFLLVLLTILARMYWVRL